MPCQAGPRVIYLRTQHQLRAPYCLLAAGLRIEGQPNEIAASGTKVAFTRIPHPVAVPSLFPGDGSWVLSELRVSPPRACLCAATFRVPPAMPHPVPIGGTPRTSCAARMSGWCIAPASPAPAIAGSALYPPAAQAYSPPARSADAGALGRVGHSPAQLRCRLQQANVTSL